MLNGKFGSLNTFGYLYVLKIITMKILVLERINQIEPVLAAFIHQKFPNAEVIMLGGIDKKNESEIISSILDADIICAQSIFNNTTAFEGIASLFKALNIVKPVYIIHTLQTLLYSLNFKINKTAKNSIAELLDSGLELYNVYFKEFENPDNDKNAYFNKPNIVKFDVVKMYYNKNKGLIWDEHLNFISNTNSDYFKKRAYFCEHEPIILSNDQINLLREMLSEVYVSINEDNENLQGPNLYLTPNEVKEFIIENEQRIALLEHLKIKPYK